MEKAREYRRLNPDKVKLAKRRAEYKRKFGITIEEYDTLYLNQGGRCAICLDKPTDRRLAVDHDHITGKIRGLLCKNCNLILGHAEDNCDILERAIKYLEERLPI
jgi:hypothetical protein